MFFWGGKGIATGDLGHHYGCLSQVAYEYPRNNKTFTQTLCNCQYYDIHFLLELEMKPFKLGHDTSYWPHPVIWRMVFGEYEWHTFMIDVEYNGQKKSILSHLKGKLTI